MIPIKPYNPHPIEGLGLTLTKRQELAQVRKALELSRDAKRHWPHAAEWSALLADLERQEADLAAEIKRTDEAVFGKAYLRPEFVNTSNAYTTKAFVREPNDNVDMPWITDVIWDSLRRLLNDPTGENIEVNAEYDVYVGSSNGFVKHIIPRFE